MQQLIRLLRHGKFDVFTDYMFEYTDTHPITIAMVNTFLQHMEPGIQEEYIAHFADIVLSNNQVDMMQWFSVNYSVIFAKSVADFVRDYNRDCNIHEDNHNHVARIILTFKWLLEQKIITEGDIRVDIYDTAVSVE